MSSETETRKPCPPGGKPLGECLEELLDHMGLREDMDALRKREAEQQKLK